jgi:hypothetical protein
VINGVFDCSGLAPYERAECYRAFADQAEQWAEEATSQELRSSYLMLAYQWRELARETQAENRVTVVLDNPDLAALLR